MQDSSLRVVPGTEDHVVEGSPAVESMKQVGIPRSWRVEARYRRHNRADRRTRVVEAGTWRLRAWIRSLDGP
jgi:hypothetical protein